MQHSTFTPVRLLLLAVLTTALLAMSVPTQQAKAGQHYLLYLPIATKQSGSAGAPERIALDRINFYRGLVTIQLVQIHPALVTAAKSHATYDILNYGDDAAWAYGPHGEVAGKPSYSGRMPGDRAVAAGYPYAGGWEVIDHYGDPTRSVDDLIGTVYHRVIMLIPSHQYVGYGNARSNVRYSDVIDFGTGATVPTGQPGVLVFPADGQINVPLQGASETPSPLPLGANYPIGYPITIQPVNGTALTISQAELRNGNGALVSIYPNPADCGTTCYALIPVNSLTVSTTYTVHVAGAVDGVSFDTTWTFTTTSCRFIGLC